MSVSLTMTCVAICYDPKLFHSIIRKQRQKGNDIILDLHVGDQCFTGEDEVINGIQKHFQDLAKCTPNPNLILTLMS